MFRGVPLALAVSAILAVAPAAADAAGTRYAAPGGSELSGCTSDEPCSIGRAIANAAPNDEVIVRTGDYGTPMAPLTVPVVGGQSGLNVHGEDGKPRPRIYGSMANDKSVLEITGAGTTVRYLEVHQLSSGIRQGSFRLYGSAEASQILATNAAAQGKACILQDTAVLKNSICLATGPTDTVGVSSWRMQGEPGTTNATIRNVTAIATSSSGRGIQALAGNAADDDHHFTITNAIARGGSGDVAADNLSGGMGEATVTIDHSNWSTISHNPPGSGTMRIVDAGGNQRFMTVAFAGPGDYHQAPGAVTIDKGADDLTNGTNDFDGDARTLGQATDIGADEFLSPPVVTTGAAGSVTQTGAVVNGTVNPERLGTSYHFDYGVSTAYGGSTPPADAGSGSADVPVDATLTGLAAGTTFHYRLVATNAGGTTLGADRTFTTQAAPGGGGPGGGPGGGGTGTGAGPHFIGALKLAKTSFTTAAKGGTKVTYTLDAATIVRFRVERAAAGRRSGKRCVRPTKKNRKAKKCTRYVSIGNFKRTSVAGLNRFRFTGRLKGKKLPVGRYRLVGAALNFLGKVSDTRRASFRIVRR